MRDIFPYGKRNNYPHMKPGDVAIWERFMLQFPSMYDKVQYDLDVGSPPPFDPTIDPVTRATALTLYRRKIDVVGFKGDEIDLIEIKPSAGPSALGQIRGYKALYIRDEKPKVEPKMIVVTDILGVDMDHLAADLGVQMVVV